MKIKMYEAKKAVFILYQQYREACEKNGYRDERYLSTEETMAQFGPFNKLMYLLKYAGYPNDEFHQGKTPEQVFDFYNRFEGQANVDFIGHVTRFFQEADPNGFIEIGSGSVLPTHL